MDVYLKGEVGATSKSDNSPLTLADLAAHQEIVRGLSAISLVYPILSEEAADIGYEERKKWKRYWLVDPLDGTKEFIKRNGEFTVNIALIDDGVPIMGVVYAPVLDVLYYSTYDGGAFVSRGNNDPESIRVRSILPNETVLVVASRSHTDERTQKLLRRLGDCESVSLGSSLKLCLVAEGAAHFYPRLGPTMEWDTAAAHAIVVAAGGRVCGRDGLSLQYNKVNLLNPDFFVFSASDSCLFDIAVSA